LQLAYSLGAWQEDALAGTALARLALDHHDDLFLRSAILSSVHDKNLPALLTSVTASKPPPPLVEQLFGLAATLKDGQEFSSLLGKTVRPQDGRFATWQLAAIAGVFEARAKRAMSIENLVKENPVIDAALAFARQKIADETASETDRLAAVALLGFE